MAALTGSLLSRSESCKLKSWKGFVERTRLTALPSHKPTATPPRAQLSSEVVGFRRTGEADKLELRQLAADVKALQALVKKQQETIETLRCSEQRSRRLETLPTRSDWECTPRVATTPQPRNLSPFDAQLEAMKDRRHLGFYDARFHSTNRGATPLDMRVLPKKLILIRHAESMGNVDHRTYTHIPDPQVPLSPAGHKQALAAGVKLRSMMEECCAPNPFRVYFYTSPYLRSKQTYEGIAAAFEPSQLMGQQEEVQLREQDYGNFQDAEGKQKEKLERIRFGRFFYRFPNGESGADVLDRLTVFEDHLIRDINAGRFQGDTALVLVTLPLKLQHGLAARIFLMRWLHWRVEQLLSVYNPPNAEPLVLELKPRAVTKNGNHIMPWVHTKALYRLTPETMEMLKGCSEDMCGSNIADEGGSEVGSSQDPHEW